VANLLARASSLLAS